MRSRATTIRRVAAMLSAGAIASATFLAFNPPATAAIVATVPLATAGNYSVLGGQTVTNTGPSVLGESLGLSPGTSITGFPPGTVLGSPAPSRVSGPERLSAPWLGPA